MIKKIKNCSDIATSKTLWGKLLSIEDKKEMLSIKNLSLLLPKIMQNITENQISEIFTLRHTKDDINFNQFLCLMASFSNDTNFKAKVAFNNLRKENKVKYENFSKIAGLIIEDDLIIKKIFERIDASGLGVVSEEDFVNFLPNHITNSNKLFSVLHKMEDVSKNINFEKVNNLYTTTKKDLLNSKNDELDIGGTSPLQLQIGFFRLVQGAAYRCFRASFTANSETHLRAYNLPYSISNFVTFIDHITKLYIDTNVIESNVIIEAEKLKELMNDEYNLLKDRIQHWVKLEKNDQMLNAENLIENEDLETNDEHELFLSIVELILSIGIDGKNHFSINHADMALNEISRLRTKEKLIELGKLLKRQTSNEISENYIDSWQRVIVDEADTHIAGSIMPVKFWYEKFMPQLLRVCSAHKNSELELIDSETENDLNDWFASSLSNGDFDPYALDINNHFLKNSLQVKKRIKQAWRLSEHYLNGVQKKREREEFGRNDGYLCEYVTFIDIYLGRNDIEKSEMRISFPYFIGPSSWRFMHTIAEISCNKQKNSKLFIDNFKNFFRSLATVYPCPYCRYHLNKYVVQNKEIERYPIEYLFLGFNNKDMDLTISLEDKLSSISNTNDMRLFLWKLHNTVSSSISRSEEWFNNEKDPLYTNRYWPSLDTELERSRAFSKKSIELSRIYKVYDLLKPISKLTTLRDEVRYALKKNDKDLFLFCRERFIDTLNLLEAKILKSGFLQDTYHYNSNLINTPPHFTHEDELYSRSGHYYEN